MTADRRSRIAELCDQALRLDAAAREAFVDAACAGDAALRHEVMAALLATQATRDAGGHAEAGAYLPAGTRLGPWRVERLIGLGGMSEVYEVRRADGAFELRAAAKLLKLGLDTQAVVARFNRERHLLAQLEHANIARVLDAGVGAQGRPFLVMEHVAGVPVNRFVATAGLGVTEVLRLMTTVCEAVQAAHAQRIVHRDLKPSNILVTGQGQVKLLDFGIAKALAESDAGATRLAGEAGALTPAYAAPEQFRGLDVSPATDVYALGVILYELLVQKPPHARGGRTLTDIVATLPRETVQAPSAMLRQERGRLPEDFRLAQLKAIPRDLDLIVLKALHAEPARRYAGAQDLADDLRRLLEHRPVRARPDSLPYRFGRYVRRNRVAASAVAAVLLALSGGLAVSLWQAHEARLARDESARRRMQADDLIGFMLGDLAQRLTGLGHLDALDSAVAKAMTYLGPSAGEKPDAGLLLRRSQALTKIIEIQTDRGQLAQAIATGEQATAAARELRRMQPGLQADEVLGEAIYSYSGALAHAGSVDRLRALAQEGRDLAQQLPPEASKDEAGALLRADLDFLYGYATAEGGGTPNPPAAAAAFQDCVSTLAPLVARADADAPLNNASQRCYDWLITELVLIGKAQPAIDAIHTMLAGAQLAVQRFPQDAVILRRLAVAAGNASQNLPKFYQYDAARQASDLALQTGQRLVAVDATNVNAMEELLGAWNDRVGLDITEGKYDEAARDLATAQALAPKVLEKQAGNQQARFLAASLDLDQAVLTFKTGGGVEQGLRQVQAGLALTQGFEKSTRIQSGILSLRAMQWLFAGTTRPALAQEALQAAHQALRDMGGDKAPGKQRAVLMYLDGRVEEGDRLIAPTGWNSFLALRVRDLRAAACAARLGSGGPACPAAEAAAGSDPAAAADKP